MSGKTLYEKLWDSTFVHSGMNGSALIYIDLQFAHEVTSTASF